MSYPSVVGHIPVDKLYIIVKKRTAILKNTVEHWKYSFDSVQAFRNEPNISIK